MIRSGLEALNGHWDKEKYAAGYRARFSSIPDSEEAHHCWRVGWKMPTRNCWSLLGTIESLQRAGKTRTRITWGLLFDAGGDARANGLPFDEERTSPWKERGSRRT
jgi:hypothetical protein